MDLIDPVWDAELVLGLLLIAFLFVGIPVLAVLGGVDSRVDELRRRSDRR